MDMPPIYHSLDILITLRCNAACKNCIKFCNSKTITGLDYSKLDMTKEHLQLVIDDIQRIGGKVFGIVCVTGGEPFIHKDAEEFILILEKEILNKGHCDRLIINTNQIIEAPNSVKKFLAPGVKPRDAWQLHNCAYLHPDDAGVPRPTYAGCTHYRKPNMVYSVQGYNLCCASDGLIRLFRLQDKLCVPHLPKKLSDFPIDNMNLVCENCTFGMTKEFFERDLGRPVSKIYLEQGTINAKLSR